MSGRPQIKIEDFCETGSGGTPSRAGNGYYDGNIPWVKSGELREDVITNTEEKITDRAISESSAKIVPKGSILLAMYGATVGRMAFLGIDAATNQAVCNIRPDPKRADPRYVFHCLQSQINHFLGRAIGGAQPNISQGIIRETRIPLPPLDEQRRIAAILDKANSLRRKRKRALSLLDSLNESIFLETFGDPESNPKGWAVHPFDEVVAIDAPLVDPKLPEYESLFHYGPDRIERDSGRLLPASTAQQDGLISNKFLCNGSHILYSKIRPYLNKVALCESVCLCSADVYPVSAKPEVIDRIYLWHLLRSNAFLKFSESHSSRANIPKINREQFLAFNAPVPPLKLQREFALHINLSQLTAKRLSFSSIQTDSLFSSLQSRAFSGQL